MKIIDKSDPLWRVDYYLRNGKVGQSIIEMEAYLSAWPQYQTRVCLDSLKSDFERMVGYWEQQVDDPQREILYRQLLQRLYVLYANVSAYRRLSTKPYLSSLYNRARTNQHDRSLSAIRQKLEGFVSEVALLQLETESARKERGSLLYKNHQQMVGDLFEYILTSRQWNESIAMEFEDLLLSPTVDSVDQQLIVSAVTLSLMNQFDFSKFQLLANVYERSQDVAVCQRALVGWVLGMDNDKLIIYPEQQEIVHRLLKKSETYRELTELQIQLFYCVKAEQDTVTIREEIMPDLLKNNSFRITRNGLEEQEEDPLEDILHPGESEERMEKLEVSFQRMMDMQRQGSDIFFGGFSQMKRSPFFYTISNWFVPFYMQHPDISQFVESLDDMSFLHKIMQNGPFCNSDKYSFVIAFQKMFDNIPSNIRDMLKRGEASLDVMDANSEENNQPAYIRKAYLMDIYRFFKLFPQRSEFHNPFSSEEMVLGECNFFCSPLFRHTDVEKKKADIVRLLYKYRFKADVVKLLDTFTDEHKDAQYYIWRMDYKRALELAPDNVFALSKRAHELYGQKALAEAVSCYERLLLLRPDNIRYQLGKAVCLIEMGQYDEVLSLLYKLNYEDAENIDVIRVLAWALLSSGRLLQSQKIYEQLVGVESPVGEDLMNYGYCLWLLGIIDDAAASFRRAADTDQTFVDEFYGVKFDEGWLHSRGIGACEVDMMQSQVQHGN